MYGLPQLINCPTRVTCNTSTLIDHILINTQNISQSGVIDIAIPDHSMIYCTRKFPKAKYNKHKELSFRLLKITQLISVKGPWKEFHFRIMKILMTLKLYITILSPDLTMYSTL